MKKKPAASALPRWILATVVILGLRAAASAASYVDFAIDDVTGESPSGPPGAIEVVSFHWTANRGESHTVQSSSNLVQWNVVDSYMAATTGTISDQISLPANTPRLFLRIGLPQVQINFLQPFIISTGGGNFYIIGQLFDPSFTVWIDGVLVSSTFIDSNTILVNVGALSAGFHDIVVRDSMNNIVASLPHGLFVTTTGRTDQESPPRTPAVNLPAVGEALREIARATSGENYAKLPPAGNANGDGSILADFLDRILRGGGPVSYDGGETWTSPPEKDWGRSDPASGRFIFDPPPESGLYDPPPRPVIPPLLPLDPPSSGPRGSVYPPVGPPQLPSCGQMGRNVVITDKCDGILAPTDAESIGALKLNPLFGAPSVNEATGELFIEYVDLVIPGRGLDLLWGRTYRSKIGLDTAMGVNWDFSYNMRAQMSGPNVTVQDGQNRTDTYFLQPDGSFSSDELFRRGTFAGPVFTLQFANNTNWVFKPIDGSPTSGKIDKIIDRNSNQIQFQYDGAGRLFLIIDSLGRPFQISYDGAGRIQAVQDFAGRTIQYQHLTAVVPGVGGVGDLVSVRSQSVTGTPNGNDFPAGKLAQFTYSTGLGGARDHNLLTARDGLNVQWFQAVYTTTGVATDFLYDRVASEIIGTAGETKVFTYLPKIPDPSSRFTATKAIVNNAAGDVHESLFDAKNRLLDLRQFTGRSTPGVAVTESTNRPINPVRPTDPAFFKTTIDWNRDSLPTRVTFPRGNGVEMVYQRDFDPAANPRERVNLRVHRQLPVSGAPLVQRFEYQSGFGTGELGMGMSAALMRITGNFCNLSIAPRQPLPVGGAHKTWLPANFRFTINDLDKGCTRVTKIDDLTIKQKQRNAELWEWWKLINPPSASSSETAKLGANLVGLNLTDALLPGGSTSFPSSITDARGFTWNCARDANGNATSMTRTESQPTSSTMRTVSSPPSCVRRITPAIASGMNGLTTRPERKPVICSHSFATPAVSISPPAINTIPSAIWCR